MWVLCCAFSSCFVWPQKSHLTVLGLSCKTRARGLLISEAPSSLRWTGVSVEELALALCRTGFTSETCLASCESSVKRPLENSDGAWLGVNGSSLGCWRALENVDSIHKTNIWAFPEAHKDYMESESGLYLERQFECCWTFQTGIVHGKITLTYKFLSALKYVVC